MALNVYLRVKKKKKTEKGYNIVYDMAVTHEGREWVTKLANPMFGWIEIIGKKLKNENEKKK